MLMMDQDLQEMISRGRRDGALSYAEAMSYLPDEDVNPEKLSKLLLALEKYQIKLVEKPAAPLSPKRAPEPNVREMRSSESAGEADVSLVPADFPKASDCLLYTSPSPRDLSTSRMPSSA